MGERTADWEHAYVFFKHEDEGKGPEFAQTFIERLRARGILPAIESAHALAGAQRLAERWVEEGVVSADTPEAEQKVIIVSLSGRGDKDVSTAATWFGMVPEDLTELGE